MDLITTAIITALANLSKDVIKDSYNILKDTLKSKFGSSSDVIDAVERLEKKPDSKGRRDTLQEEIENAKVYDYDEIVQLAQSLLDKLQDESSEKQIIDQNQINTASDNTVGGDFNFSPIQEGFRKA